MDKTQVEKARDFFSQKITYEEISAILQAIYPSVKGYSVKSIKQFCKQNGISPRIFQDHMQAVAEVQKDFYKIYSFE